MTPHPVHRRKKLIEVAIPLEAINAASAREKSIRHGHPSPLHLWWARRPLAAARAVIFCQMVDDPSAVPEEFPTDEAQEHERLRLFALISELVTWENTTNKKVLNRARAEIRRSWRRACADNADHPEAAELFNPEKLPGFHDPLRRGWGVAAGGATAGAGGLRQRPEPGGGADQQGDDRDAQNGIRHRRLSVTVEAVDEPAHDRSVPNRDPEHIKRVLQESWGA
jgi:hypothetical protein